MNKCGFVLVLIGLPGAGKSTLCARLARSGAALARELALRAVSVEVVSFDELMQPPSRVDELIHRPSRVDDGACSLSIGEERSWKELRAAVLDVAAARIADAQAYCSGTTEGFVLVLDDNMMYRSMRLQCYRLARRCGARYVQVHVATHMEECVQRDGRRQGAKRVGEDVIARMAAVLEVPDRSISWERYSVEVPGDAAEDEAIRVIAHVLKQSASEEYITLEEEEMLRREQDERLRTAREETARDVLHQAELVWREEVKRSFSRLTAGKGSKKERAAASKKLTEKSRVLKPLLLRQVKESLREGMPRPAPADVAQFLQPFRNVVRDELHRIAQDE